MTMTEFKDMVKDVGLETKDLRFDVMQNMCAISCMRATCTLVRFGAYCPGMHMHLI